MSEELDVRWAHVRWWLESVRRAAVEIEPLQRELVALEDAKRDCLPWQTKGSTLYASMGGTHSDPTASEAQARIDGLDGQIVDVRSRIDACERTVGDCLRMLDAMRRELGACYADVIEAYYIDCADTWSEVAWDMGKHRDTVRIWRDAAFDWLDANSARYGMMV
jgi:hypothetical protein